MILWEIETPVFLIQHFKYSVCLEALGLCGSSASVYASYTVQYNTMYASSAS